MIAWNIVYILYLLCNFAILLFDSLSTLIFLPLLLILWLAGGSWGDYSVGQIISQKETESVFCFYSALLCLPCDDIAVFAVAVAHLERSNHLSWQP